MEVNNKKADFLYDFEIEIEAGLVLRGNMVKQLRKNPPSLGNMYGYVQQSEIFLKNIIPEESVKCLLRKNQIKRIIGLYSKNNCVIVPTSFYDIRGKFKVTLGIGTRSKQHDLREKIKQRDVQRRGHD